MIKRLLPFMNHNENSFVQFLEETKHLEPRIVNTKTSIILESYDTRLGTSEKNHDGNEGGCSVINISNSKKSNKSNGKERNLLNKCNIYNSSSSKKKDYHANDEIKYMSFGNLKEKLNIENSLITTNTKKQSLFGENPLEVYRSYNNEIKLNNSMSRVKEATEMLNKIIENIKVIPILCLKEDRKKDIENKEKNRKNRKEKEEIEENEEEGNSVDDNKNLKYKCEYCDKYFNSASSKGGHIRSHHPGKSEKYKKKIAKANERASIRELNKEAQKIYLIKIKNQYNKDKILSKQVEIKKIKDELLKKGKGCEEN